MLTLLKRSAVLAHMLGLSIGPLVAQGNTQVQIPENAYVFGNQWLCNAGYYRSGDRCLALDVPENAYVFGNQWLCNAGYYRSGNRCLALDVPENAYVHGNQWFCNRGFKKQGAACIEMAPEEAELQRIEMLRAIESAKDEEIGDLGITLRDFERRCEVWRWSDNYGEIECRGSDFGEVERQCEAYFSGRFEKDGGIDCRGSELRAVEANCSVSMYSDSYAEIDC